MTRSTNPKPPAPYFVSGIFDFAFVGGISMACFAVIGLWGPNGYSVAAMNLSIYLMWIINWPHFSATIYRLFRSKENVAQYPMTAYVIPFLLLAFALGAFLSPTLIARYFVKLFLIWSPYHFSGQSVGISLIYARRHSVRIDKWPRLALATFIFGTYVSSTLASETSITGTSYFGIDTPGLGVPAWMPGVAQWIMYLGGVAFILFAVDWSRKNHRFFPLIVLMPALTQYVWFLAGAGYQAFAVFVPMFHSLQYLPIAWAMELGEGETENKASQPLNRVRNQTLVWAGANLMGGVLLFYVLPRIVQFGGMDFDFVCGVTLAAVQIHHFFVDGVIWKLRNPGVSSPLMANIRDYLDRPLAFPSKAAA